MSSVAPHRRGLSVAVAVLMLGALAGAAFAFWSSPGSGVGNGATGSTAPVTLLPGTPASTLYPGGAADVTLTISNPNPTLVTVEVLALDVSQGVAGFSVDADHSGCDTAALSYAPQTNSGSGWSAPARVGGVDGVLSVTLSGALSMSPDAASACQDATISVHLMATT